MGILDEAQPVGDTEPYIKMLLHSDPGVGKTYWAANAPDPCFEDFERSTETLRKVEKFKDIPVFRPKNFAKAKEFAMEAVKKYGTVIFDTVSSMQVMYMNEYMEKIEKLEKSKKPDRNRWMPYQGDYRHATNELTDFWLTLQRADCHIIFLAHTKLLTNDEGQTVGKVPMLSPAVKDSLAQFVNVVAYMEKKTTGMGDKRSTDRYMYFNSTNIIQAKNRLGIQEEFVKNPKFEEIFSYGTGS